MGVKLGPSRCDKKIDKEFLRREVGYKRDEIRGS
jgi:hypothetical protein